MTIACACASACASAASGTIQGTVTTTAAQPIATGAVEVFDSSGNLAGSALLDNAGAYAVPVTWLGTAATTCYARTVSTGFLDELFNDHPCLQGSCTVTSGTPIVVQPGGTAVADFVLASDLVFGDSFENAAQARAQDTSG